MRKIIIGSRGSELALWQANYVLQKVQQLGLSAEIKIIATQGDQIQNLSFDKLEGKGFFTKEIEEALLNKEIDLAVHSHKDLPTTSPKGLMIAAVSEREDPAELLLIRKECIDDTLKFSLKKEAVVGTSSARRKSQLLAFRKDIVIQDLRGNVPTRIQKLRDKKYDAIMLAMAGVERLRIDLSEFNVIRLDPKEFISAPAQGVLALQIRESDNELLHYIQQLTITEVQQTIEVERKILNLFDGGCQLPLGVYCINENNTYKVWASKADAWDQMPKRIYMESSTTQELAEKIVTAIQSIRPASVLITRDLIEHSFFKNVLEGNGYQVKGISLIETTQVPYNSFPETDWVFFPSGVAVQFFFEQKPVLKPGIKYATVGKSTAEALKKYDCKADFIGTSNDTTEIGKEFAKTVGTATVLFPQSRNGMRTIQKQFKNPNQVKDLIVYETLSKKRDTLPEAEILVFTSPSNVASFFEKEKIKKEQQIIAIGKSTEKKLNDFGITNCTLPSSYDETGLVQAVFSLS